MEYTDNSLDIIFDNFSDNVYLIPRLILKLNKLIFIFYELLCWNNMCLDSARFY